MREQGNYLRPFGIGCSQGELLSHGGHITWCVEYEKGALCECKVFVCVKDMYTKQENEQRCRTR